MARDSANSEAIVGAMPISLPLDRAVPALMASTTRTGTTILTTTAFIHMDRTTVGRPIHARTMVAALKVFIPHMETLTSASTRTAVRWTFMGFTMGMGIQAITGTTSPTTT